MSKLPDDGDPWAHFLCFSHDAPGAWPVWTPGAQLAGFIKRTSIHCYTQNRKAHGLGWGHFLP